MREHGVGAPELIGDGDPAAPTPRVVDDSFRELAAYRKCVEQIRTAWPAFVAKRRERLQQGGSGPPVEKVAENILEDLFTTVLDWPRADVQLQVGYADIVLSTLGLKRLVLEVKRPGALIGRRAAIEAALRQARRYEAEQTVMAVAVSDATMLYAADISGGGLRHRVWVKLDTEQAPQDLWWLSVHGIYRLCPDLTVELGALPIWDSTAVVDVIEPDMLLHPKYARGMQCFAYVGAANDTRTWKLPYLEADGVTPDRRRLHGAIQCIVRNYRGTQVVIPTAAVPDVLVRLGIAAKMLRKMPCQNGSTTETYRDAHQVLEQLKRLTDVGCCPEVR
jgi:hypothetical protein